jgi:hypothetical protein
MRKGPGLRNRPGLQIMIIKPRNLVIDNPEIASFLISNKINHLCFVPSLGGDDSIVAKYPDYANEISFGRKWFKVHLGPRKVSVRTPNFLLPYEEKEVEFFIERDVTEKFEAFRMKTVGFLPEGMFSRKRIIIRDDVPYITKTGRIVLPKEYIAEYKLRGYPSARIFADRTNDQVVKSGMIWLVLDTSMRSGPSAYALKNFGYALRTKRVDYLTGLVEMLGKKIYNFRYRTTVRDETLNQDVIVFKEQVDES